LELLRKWLLERIEGSLGEAQSAVQKLADCVPAGHANVEARKRRLEGLGQEALSRRLTDAGKDLDTLTAQLGKLRAK
jgi:hypothetical protein